MMTYLKMGYRPMNLKECFLKPTFMVPTFGRMPGSFYSSQINVFIMGIGVLRPQFIVSSKGLGLHKILTMRGFKPSTSSRPYPLALNYEEHWYTV